MRLGVFPATGNGSAHYWTLGKLELGEWRIMKINSQQHPWWKCYYLLPLVRGNLMKRFIGPLRRSVILKRAQAPNGIGLYKLFTARRAAAIAYQ